MTAPLAGRRIVVTREEDDDGPLGRALSTRGADVIRVPCVRTLPPLDAAPLAEALAGLADFDWIVLTSARAVEAIAGAGREGTGPAGGVPAGAGPAMAVVGEGTAAALRRQGQEPTVVGDGGGVELVARLREAVAPRPLTGARILFPASDRAREETVRALEAAGARVTQVPAYRTLAREEAPAELHRLLGEGVDAVTFTSPSAARALGAPPRSAGLPRVAALGETTAAPLRAAGWPDIIVPERPGLDDLAEALARSFAGAEE